MPECNTLQKCFLACAKDASCQNVFLEHVVQSYMVTPPATHCSRRSSPLLLLTLDLRTYLQEAPPPMQCTLLGPVTDPSSACSSGTGTLVRKLHGPRSCAAAVSKDRCEQLHGGLA